MRPTGLMIHYAEVATKGKNRPKFIKRLAGNVKLALAGLPFRKVKIISGRLWAPCGDDVPNMDEVAERMVTVYGISSYSPAVRVPLELDAMKQKALELVREREYQTFRVSARRVFKDLPFRSLDVDREVGAYLCEHRPAKVQLKDPELQVFIEMLPERAYVYIDKLPGPRGLPMGMTGRVACLLSGGIDSPVAAARVQKRGCHAVFVHFHSHPFLSKASQEKAIDLATHLARYQREAVLHLVPFGELQREIVASVPPPLRVVLYRRFMLRIAGRIGERERCRALVTGESLGQVASQTLSNMVAIDSATPLPVMRPLIGFDKQEIIEAAQALGTYETSILPDQDCCTLFIPRDPETHAKLAEVEAAEAALDIGALCDDAIARAEVEELRAPWAEAPRAPRREDAEKEVAGTEAAQTEDDRGA